MKTQGAKYSMGSKIGLILFIDDDEEDNLIHAETIKKSGLAERCDYITEARDSISYLKYCLTRQNPEAGMIPDLIFIDLNMPLYNGYELVDEFRKFPDPFDRKKDMRFVLMTGTLHTHMTEYAQQEYSDLITAVVQKPITSDLLKDILEKYC
jgi:CheY-like chemotaxis protein